MFFIPAWITNFTLLVTCYISGYQLVQFRRPNPLLVLQFYMILFCLLLMVLVALYNRVDPWWSLGFFVIAVVNISVILRQNRLLPPRKRIE